MTESDCWILIDDGIAEFKSKEGWHKGIRVDRKPHSDWLIFNRRQLTWTFENRQYLIEIFPKFENEIVVSWHIYTAVYYDSEDTRFYLSWERATSATLDFIAANAYQLIRDCFDYIIKVNKEDIPARVNLSR